MAVVPQIDARLAEQETDGWRYADMPEDGQAWRDSLRYLDADGQAASSCVLAEATVDDQRAVIQAVQDLGAKDWHGLNAAHVWSLWTRYACTAFSLIRRRGTRSDFPAPPIPAVTRIPV